MICKYCGAEIPEGSMFCTACGQKMTASGDEYFAPGYNASAESAYGGYEAPAEPVYGGYSAPAEPVYGGYSAPTEPVYGGYASSGYSDFDAPVGVDGSGEISSPEKPKGKGLKLGLLLGSIGLVLVVGVVILWIVLGFSGPVTDIAMAYSDLMESGNFTMEMEVDGETATVMVDMDLDERELTMCLVVDDEIEMAIFDGNALTRYYDDTYHAQDISDELDDVFDEYEEFELEEIDWEELLTEIDDDLYDEASEYIDFDALNDCLVAYFKTINDEDWLEENAGFSEKEKKGVTYYIFEPDFYDFLDASLVEFEEVFVDEDDYEDVVDALEEIEPYTDEVQLELSFGLDGGDLVSIDISGDVDGDRGSIGIEFFDIGETEIDIDELEDILDDAEDY